MNQNQLPPPNEPKYILIEPEPEPELITQINRFNFFLTLTKLIVERERGGQRENTGD